MKIIKINPQKPQPEVISEAAKTLKLGGMLVYPTDTCYGLGVDITNPVAVAKIYRLKTCEKNKPISMIINDIEEIQKYCDVDKKRTKYMSKYFPGAVTFILLNIDFKHIKQNTNGIRIPDCQTTKAISQSVNFPFTTTSANISGMSPCYSIIDLKKQFKNLKYLPDLALDAGKLPQNPPSTVVEIINWPPRILREGAVKIK